MKKETVSIGIRIPLELKTQIEKLANEDDRSFTYQVISLLKSALSQHGLQELHATNE